ncbi:MAG: HNH/ENDO VII family nuclease [Clostridiales bacterium]|nr:HNH/ENDO VII family nuclease [Clostridiales bacterium]
MSDLTETSDDTSKNGETNIPEVETEGETAETKGETQAKTEEIDVKATAEKEGVKQTYLDKTETKENPDGTVDSDSGFQETGLSEEERVAIKDRTGWSDTILDNIKSPEEAAIYEKAGLKESKVGGHTALIGEFNLNQPDPDLGTNADRIKHNVSPIDKNGEKIELHHIGQHVDSPLAELTFSRHHQGGNYKILHDTSKSKETEAHADGTNWPTECRHYWKARAEEAKVEMESTTKKDEKE